jgi:hypothetical protein
MIFIRDRDVCRANGRWRDVTWTTNAWTDRDDDLCTSQYRQFQVVGRHLPTEATPEPEVFRMKLWALDDVKARSKFWCVRGDERDDETLDGPSVHEPRRGRNRARRVDASVKLTEVRDLWTQVFHVSPQEGQEGERSNHRLQRGALRCDWKALGLRERKRPRRQKEGETDVI